MTNQHTPGPCMSCHEGPDGEGVDLCPLHAAALELLAALEYAEGWADLLPDDAAAKVRAAIAKARGE